MPEHGPEPDPGRPILITGGDPAGIGPELVLKIVPDLARANIPVIYFSTSDEKHNRAFEELALNSGMDFRRKSHGNFFAGPDDRIAPSGEMTSAGPFVCLVEDPGGSERTFFAGQPNENSGRAAMNALRSACDYAAIRKPRGLLTAPLSKEWVARSGVGNFSGHTGYLASRFNSNVLMLMHGEKFSVVPLTVHIPLEDVPRTLQRVLTGEEIFEPLEQLRAMKDFRTSSWAMCSLNPHGGEGGLLGSEEEDFIKPALMNLRERGFGMAGPLPSDALFQRDNLKRYRLIFGCYHDQVLTPFKALEGMSGINCTVGLPFPRSSPDHGTAFELAGKDEADPLSMKKAFQFLTGLDDNQDTGEPR